MAVDQIARMMALDAAQQGGGGGDAYTKAETDELLDSKADLVDGKVPASQLPSYVDDVLEYASTSSFPATGESGKIYIATDTNKTYRWGGTGYVEISESLALGETASTAYPGNKGKANADAISAIKDGTNIDSFADVETALANIPQVTVDQTYSASSTNAQSGTAVAQALGTIPSVTVDQTYDAASANAQSGVAVAQAISGKANSSDLATVATSGSYNDLTNTPTIPADQVNADWNAVSGVEQILNKPTIPTVDQTYNAQSANAQSGTAVAQAVQDSGSEYSARVMNLEAAYGDPDYLEGLGYWGLVYHTKEYVESGSALSTLRNVTITPGTIILLKWDSADGRGYKDLTYMFSRIGMARYAPDYPVASAGWSVRIVRYETDSQYTDPEPLPDDFDAVIYTSSIAYGSSESYSHSIIKAPPMKPGKYYYYAIEFLNDNESASFTCSFNQKVIAYFLQEPSNQPIMYDGVTRQQFIMPKGIKSTDYATQTTGGTIKAWTTTDGSDTILHLATQ